MRPIARLAFWLGGALLAFAAFVEFTGELLESPTLLRLDEAVLLFVTRWRVGWLNAAAVDVTALGSPTLVTLHSVLTFTLLVMVRDWLSAVQLVTASAGAGVLSVLTKTFIERERPDVVPRLVEVSSFSYPSGHSLAAAAMYLTIGFIVGAHLPSSPTRAVVLGLSTAVIGIVALSRVYLGVHYPSDIVSGVMLGASWALFVAGGFSLFKSREGRDRRRFGGPEAPTDRGQLS